MMTWLFLLLLYAAPQEARTVVVPKVIGLTVSQAEAVIADAGLKVAEVKEVPSKAPRGIVVGQGPGPGQRVRINFECSVVIPVSMASLVGFGGGGIYRDHRGSTGAWAVSQPWFDVEPNESSSPPRRFSLSTASLLTWGCPGGIKIKIDPSFVSSCVPSV
jgi:hypothetical protein